MRWCCVANEVLCTALVFLALQKGSPPAAVSPGAAAGIAIAATVTVCAAIGLAVWLIHGRKRKQAAAAADKDDMASQSSGRRVSGFTWASAGGRQGNTTGVFDLLGARHPRCCSQQR